ncbi:hypothetical protein QUA27_24545, partial [Microcoleus sp. Pol14C6]|uniref:hypothetical protein n=1 Tax=unclassified Microcoleus TaxID=2642155 RepID=UPI002FD51530
WSILSTLKTGLQAAVTVLHKPGIRCNTNRTYATLTSDPGTMQHKIRQQTWEHRGVSVAQLNNWTPLTELKYPLNLLVPLCWDFVCLEAM